MTQQKFVDELNRQFKSTGVCAVASTAITVASGAKIAMIFNHAANTGIIEAPMALGVSGAAIAFGAYGMKLFWPETCRLANELFKATLDLNLTVVGDGSLTDRTRNAEKIIQKIENKDNKDAKVFKILGHKITIEKN